MYEKQTLSASQLRLRKNWASLQGATCLRPGFVLGNGWSRTYYPIERLAKRGVVAVCNRLGYEYPGPHVWCFGDGMFSQQLAQARPEPIHRAQLLVTDLDNRIHWPLPPDNLRFYPRRPATLGMAPPYQQVIPSSAGNVAFQVLHFLGCDPIYLIGMDGAYERLADGSLRGNVYDDKLVNNAAKPYRGQVSRSHLIGWAEELLQMVEACQRGRENRTILRVGNHGVLTEIPWISWNQLETAHVEEA